MKHRALKSAALGLCAAIAVLSGAPTHGGKHTGTAVFYSDKMDGRGVALKGDKYDKSALTAATHPGYPLGSMVKVTNLSNQKSVTVKVNDRMNPKSKNLVDLSRKAAEEIDMVHSGHTKVRLEPVSSK